MLLFDRHPDPTLNVIGSDNYDQDVVRYFPQVSVNWQAQSSAHALLLNEAGRLVYGGATIEYVLNAFTKTYGGAAMEYILGLIVPISIADTLDGVSSFVLARELVLSFGSSFNGTSAMLISKFVDMSMDSTGVLTSGFMLSYEMSLAIAEVLEATTGFSAEGEGTTVWVFNTKTFAPSRYEGLDVRSLAKLGTTVYGAGPTGIFEFAGDDDNGVDIQASFIVGRSNSGVSNTKRFAYGYVHGTSDDKLEVRVVDDKGEVFTYETERALGDKIRSVRFKVGKGLKSHYWQFEIRNKSGGSFEVHHVDLLPAVLERWVKG